MKAFIPLCTNYPKIGKTILSAPLKRLLKVCLSPSFHSKPKQIVAPSCMEVNINLPPITP